MLNKAQVIGHLGGDVEVKYTQAGTAVANFSIATTERYKDKNGDQQEKTEWHRITAFDKLGELAGEYLSKGKLAYVEGRIQTDKWKDDNGVDRYTTKIIAQQIKFLSPREGGSDERQSRPERSSSNQPAQRRAPPVQQQAPMDDFSDDDIPF